MLAVAFDARSGNPARRGRPGSCRERSDRGACLGSTGTDAVVDQAAWCSRQSVSGDTRVARWSRDGAALRPRPAAIGRRWKPSNLARTGDGSWSKLVATVIEALELCAWHAGTAYGGDAESVLFSTWNVNGTRVVFKRFGLAILGGRRRQRRLRTRAQRHRERLSLLTRARIRTPSSPSASLPETSGDVFLLSMSGAFAPRPLIVAPGL